MTFVIPVHCKGIGSLLFRDTIVKILYKHLPTSSYSKIYGVLGFQWLSVIFNFSSCSAALLALSTSVLCRFIYFVLACKWSVCYSWVVGFLSFPTCIMWLIFRLRNGQSGICVLWVSRLSLFLYWGFYSVVYFRHIFKEIYIWFYNGRVSIGTFFSGREWLLSLAHCRVWHELRRPSGNSVNKLFNSCRYAKQDSAFCVW